MPPTTDSIRLLIAAANQQFEEKLVEAIRKDCPSIDVHPAKILNSSLNMNELCNLLASKVKQHHCQFVVIDHVLIERSGSATQLRQALKPARSLLLIGSSIHPERMMDGHFADSILTCKQSSLSKKTLRSIANLITQEMSNHHKITPSLPKRLENEMQKIANYLRNWDDLDKLGEDDEVFSELMKLTHLLFHNSQKLSGNKVEGAQNLLQMFPNDCKQFVVKFARKADVEAEIQNYQTHLHDKRLAFRCMRLERHVSLWYYSIVLYSFVVGGDRPPKTFCEYYRTKSAEKICKVLQRTWLDRYIQIGEGSTIIDLYERMWFSPENISLFPIKNKEVQFSRIPYRLPNPSAWLQIPEHKSEASRYNLWEVNIHQDLVADHILIDDNDFGWVINFQNSGPGPVFQDFVALEADIFISLVDVLDHDLPLLFRLAVRIADLPMRSRGSEHEQDKGLILHDSIDKAWTIIDTIRTLADQRVGLRGDREPEYLWSLLLNTFYRTFNIAESDPRFWRSLLLCSVLCDRLKQWAFDKDQPWTLKAWAHKTYDAMPYTGYKEEGLEGDSMEIRAIFAHGYALLVGVGQTSYEERWSLPITVNDVQRVREKLIDPDHCAYPADRARLLQNESATKANINAGLDWLAACTKYDNEATVIVYFSGHGWRTDEGRYAMIPSDVRPGQFAETVIWEDEFTNALRRIQSKRLLVIIDTCHAAGMASAKHVDEILPDGFSKAAAPDNLLRVLKQGQGRAVISSCRDDQKSYYRDEKLSIFTEHLLEALDGAANVLGDTEVRVSNLINHVGKRVPESARNYCAAEQTPWTEQASEDFAIALLKGGKGLLPTISLPPLLPGSKEIDIQAVRERLKEKNEDELMEFIQNYFPEIASKLPVSMTLDARIQNLIDDCYRKLNQGKWQRLVDLLFETK